MHDNFTFLPFFRYNYATEGGTNVAGARSVLDQTWTEFQPNFCSCPMRLNFSFGIAGIGHHKIIEESMEFYFKYEGYQSNKILRKQKS